MNVFSSPRRRVSSGALLASAASLLSMVVCGPRSGYGQGIQISGQTTYTQNFNTLGSGTVPWVNGSTVPGWYVSINDGFTAPGNLQASNGTTDPSGLLNLGASGAADRAIGSKATGTGSLANIAYGVLFQNTSPDRMKVSTISYAGEQWRTNSGAIAETWTTFYKTSFFPITEVESGGSSATADPATFTALPPSLNWNSPNNSPGSAARDGNQAANRTVMSASLSTVIIEPNAYFMIRWVDTNLANTDGHQGIDDVSVSFTRYRMLSYNLDHTAGGAPNGTLAVGGGAYWLDNGAPATLMTGDDVSFIQPGNATLNVPANVSLGTMTVDSPLGTYTIGGPGRISGTLAKYGDGTLVLTSPNSFTGPVLVAGGVVETRANGALGTGGMTLSSFGTFRTSTVPQIYIGNILLETSGGSIQTESDLTVNGNLTGFSPLIKSGAGVLVFNGTSTANGGISVEQGTLRVPNFAAIGTNAQSIRLNGGTFEIPSTATVIYNDASTITRNLFADSVGTFSVPSTTAGNAVVISRQDSVIGSGTIIKSGAGTLRLTAAQPQFFGNWEINGGFLELQTVATGLGNGTVIVNAGGTIAPQGLTVPNAITLSGGALGTRSSDATIYSGMVNVLTDSVVALRSSISPTVAQNITVSGVLSGTGELTIQGTTQPAAGNTRALILRNTANNYEGTFTVTSQQNLLNQATSGAGKTLGTSTVRLRGGTLQIRDNGTGNNGTLAYGNNIETGAPTDLLQPGISTLFVDRFSANTGNTIALGTLTMGDHTLALTGANGYRASFSGGTFNGNAVLQTNDTTVPILNGNYGGTGGFTKAGTGSLVFAGTSSYTGSTVVSAGTLTLTGSVASSSRVDVKSGAILNVAGVTSGFVVPVEQVLTGAGTVQGGVTVDGKLAPGDGIGTMGTLVFTTTVTLDGTAEFEIRKQGVVLSSDVAGVTGSLTLGGILNVTAVGDPLAFGDTFDLFDAGSFLGNFTDINLPGLPGGLAWSTDQLATEGEITVVPEPGAVGMLLGGLGVLVGVRRRHDARLARR